MSCPSEAQQCSTQDVWSEEMSCQLQSVFVLNPRSWSQPQSSATDSATRSHHLKCNILSRAGICRSSPGGTYSLNSHLNPNPVLEQKQLNKSEEPIWRRAVHKTVKKLRLVSKGVDSVFMVSIPFSVWVRVMWMIFKLSF